MPLTSHHHNSAMQGVIREWARSDEGIKYLSALGLSVQAVGSISNALRAAYQKAHGIGDSK